MRLSNLIFIFFFPFLLFAQKSIPVEKGSIAGNIQDSSASPLAGASINLKGLFNPQFKKSIISTVDGGFIFNDLPFGYYVLSISSVGFNSKTIDSIFLRSTRSEIILSDLILNNNPNLLQEFVVYAEKPLIQSKDGNVVFNAAESPLANGSNASELLRSVPLVSNDPNGKLTVKGKEPKVLIDDKPVELNAQQLQELLESLPGSMIEKIEVMTNPPARYQNEPGGVINIVTKKGKVGKSGRISTSIGTLGDIGLNASYNYRSKGLIFSLSVGNGNGVYQGNSYSKRQNIYKDSVNYFNTTSHYKNNSNRPYVRANIDFDINKDNSISATLLYNQSNTSNQSGVWYTNINRFNKIYRLSNRAIKTVTENYTPSISLSYLHKSKLPGATLRAWLSINFSDIGSNRDFNQVFFNPDSIPNGIDSFQTQETLTKLTGFSLRSSYDYPLKNKKTSISTGGYYSSSGNHVLVNTSFRKKPENVMLRSDLLSNDFLFQQALSNLRISIQQKMSKNTSLSGGVNLEYTNLLFEVYQQNLNASNNYWSFLPYFNYNKAWKDKLNLTVSYRRTITRPGIYQLNPSVEYGDPYNLRFGNAKLEASTSHTVDMVIGTTKEHYFTNFGFGHNIVQNAFAQIRTLQPDGKTFITWQNIGDRKEFEISNWSGYNFSTKFRTNMSASYSYHVYSENDRTQLKYRNGGTITSNLNSSYVPNEKWNVTGSITFNRFGNPQGYVKWNTSVNLGLQKKIFHKKMTIGLNLIDPFLDQKNRIFTYGSNFNHESFSLTKTSNYRITIGYNFIVKPKINNPLLEKIKTGKK